MRRFEGFQKGVNLGGWISQFDQYSREHFDRFITESDIAEIAELGFDHVRVPVDYNVLEDEDGRLLTEGFRYLEDCRAWCEAHRLNMLIDLHECFGYSFDPLKKDMDRTKFFYDEALQERFLKLWSEIAHAFRDFPRQVAFEPLNEVVPDTVVTPWNELVARYIDTVRTVAPEHAIVVGGVCYNNVLSVPLLKIPTDEHIIYNFHCYEPMAFTHQGAYWVDKMPADYRVAYPENIEEYRRISRLIDPNLGGAVFCEGVETVGPELFEIIFAPAIEKAEKDGVALYCGEYGVIDLAENKSKLRWLSDIHAAFEKHGIGHALWNYKEKDFGLVDESFREIKEDFIALNRRGD